MITTLTIIAAIIIGIPVALIVAWKLLKLVCCLIYDFAGIIFSIIVCVVIACIVLLIV